MSDKAHKSHVKTGGSSAPDGSHRMTGLETTIISGIPKVVPPAARAVRKALEDQQDQRAMVRFLEQAMTDVADTFYSADEKPGIQDIAKVAAGAINIARTGSARPVGKIKKAWLARPAVIGGYHRKKLQVVPVEAASDELGLWVRASGRDLGVELPRAEEYARLVARRFVNEILKPTPSQDTAAFVNRLTREWLDQAEIANGKDRLRNGIGYSVVLSGAAAGAAAIFKLPPEVVVQIAEAVGATSLTVGFGLELIARGQSPDIKAKTEAEFFELLSLLERIAAFIVDLTRVSFPQVPPLAAAVPLVSGSPSKISADGENIQFPDLLVALIEELDKHLIPEARMRAPLLGARLQRVYDQLRLYQQRRPSFSELALRDAVRDLWQTLERVGFKNHINVPNPFELPADKDVHLALSPPPEKSTEA